MHSGKFRKSIDNVRNAETLEVMYLESCIYSIHNLPYDKAGQQICPIQDKGQ